MSRKSIRHSLVSSMPVSGVMVMPSDASLKMQQLSQETVGTLQIIWREAGYEEDECQALLGDLYTKLQVICRTEVAAETRILELARDQVLHKYGQLADLYAKIGREFTLDVSTLGNTCADRLAQLEVRISQVTDEVKEIQASIGNEVRDIEAMILEIDEPTMHEEFLRGDVAFPELSDARLQYLRSTSAALQKRKALVHAEILDCCVQCYKVFEEMAVPAEGSRTLRDWRAWEAEDRVIMSLATVTNESESLLLKVDVVTLRSLRQRLTALVEEREARRAELTRMGEDIARLWMLLRVPTLEREKFQASFAMTLSMSTMSRGQQELRRLKELRTLNLGKVVAGLRQEVQALWEECALGDEQRRSELPQFFLPLHELDDDAVDAHDRYNSTLKERVERLRPILLKIQSREAIVEDRIELERIQLNPDRLKNRGASAFAERKKEEAMIKGIRTLEKLTEDIQGMIMEWELSYGPFTYAGIRYSDRIAEQDATYLQIKESLRTTRSQRKDGKTESTPQKPELLRRHLNAPPTPVAVAATPKLQEAKDLSSSFPPSSSRVASTDRLHASSGTVLSKSSIELQSSAAHAFQSSNIENIVNQEESFDASSIASDESEYTSATEVRERHSTTTVIRNTGPSGQF